MPVPLTVNESRGVGIGGTVGANAGFGLQVSIEGAPWTRGTASVKTVMTSFSSFGDIYSYGFAHTPLSATSLTGGVTGTVKLVTPIRVTTNLPGLVVGGFATLTVRFVPEPNSVLMLGCGALGLALIGRRRLKP